MSTTASYLRIATTLFATAFIGFGLNVFLNPASALSFFELEYPTISTHRRLIDVILAVYAVRDIFMGVALYAAAAFGNRQVLGWITVAAGAVAGADGAICKFMVGKGEMNHWGYGGLVVVIGAMLALG